MSAKQQKRLILVLSLVLGVGVAMGLIMFALSQNINLFYTPTQLVEQAVRKNQSVRIGGMVVKNSVQRKDNMQVEFVITDYKREVKVHYQGILPDLFREGQGIVALGKVTKDGSFAASQVLAKHDENYMPPEITKALKQSATIPLKQSAI